MWTRAIQFLTNPISRKRPWYFAAIIATIALGLLSRRVSWLFPATLGKYPGDVLWAVMVFLLYALLFPKHSTLRIAIYALATSIFIEFFKLYPSPTIDLIRNTPIGRLIFGYVFSWQNLLAYYIGILTRRTRRVQLASTFLPPEYRDFINTLFMI